MRSKAAILIAALLVPLLGGCTWPFLDESGIPLSEISVFGSPLPDRHDIPYDSAPTPTFGSPTSTADGFTVQITNFDPSYNWVLTTTAGVVNLQDGGLIQVAGLAPDTSAQVTVSVQRYNFYDAQATITGVSLAAEYSPPEVYPSMSSRAVTRTAGLPGPAALGLRPRDWKQVKPTPGCAVASRCRLLAFRNIRADQPLRYFETEVARFGNARTASAQYARMLRPFTGSRQAAQRRRNGFRYAVIGGLGALQLPGRDIGAANQATLAVIAVKGRMVQLVVVSGDLGYLTANARNLLSGRASRLLIRLARHPQSFRPPLGPPLPGA